MEKLVLFCFWILPFELISYGILRKINPDFLLFNYFFHPLVLICLCSLVYWRSWYLDKNIKFLSYCLVGLALGYITSGLYNQVDLLRLFSITLLGPLAIILLINLLSKKQLLEKATIALVGGITLWCLACLACYIVLLQYPFWITSDFKDISSEFSSYHLDTKILVLRYVNDFYFPGRLPLFYILVSNMNKASNCLVLSVILQLFLYIKGTLSFRYFSFIFAVHTLLLICVFSRGGFLALFVCALMVILFRMLKNKSINPTMAKKLNQVALLLLIPGLISVSTATFRNYWVNSGVKSYIMRLEMVGDARINAQMCTVLQSTPDNHPELIQNAYPINIRDSKNNSIFYALVHANEAPRYLFYSPLLNDLVQKPNVQQQNRLYEGAMFDCPQELSLLDQFFWGYGVGNYGLSQKKSPEAGTHFLLLDAWAEGGVLGIVSLSLAFLLFLVLFWRSLLTNTSLIFSPELFIGLLGISILFLLGLREYSFVYLFVQSIGAVFFALFSTLVFLGFNDAQKSNGLVNPIR